MQNYHCNYHNHHTYCHHPICFIFLAISIIAAIIISIFITTLAPRRLDNLTAINTNVQEGNTTIIPLVLNENRIQNGNNIEHFDTNSEIQINDPGVYLISYNVTGSLRTGGTPAEFSIGLYLDNVLIPDTLLNSLVIPSGQETTLSNTTLVEVSNTPAFLTIQALATSSIIYQDISISVVKIQ